MHNRVIFLFITILELRCKDLGIRSFFNPADSQPTEKIFHWNVVTLKDPHLTPHTSHLTMIITLDFTTIAVPYH